MTAGLATIESAGIVVDHAAILRALKLDPRDANTQALLLVCERYGLDPLLKHMVLITGNPYITRDGYLAIAHRSGVFDGMEVVDQGSDGTHYIAKVAVYRKDMSHPFTFVGRFPKNKNMAKDYGPEMAVKVAEVQALRRAFNVTGVPASDERWDVDPAEVVTATVPPPNVDTSTGEVLSIEPPKPETKPKPATRRRPPPTKTPTGEPREAAPSPSPVAQTPVPDGQAGEASASQAPSPAVPPKVTTAQAAHRNACSELFAAIGRVPEGEPRAALMNDWRDSKFAKCMDLTPEALPKARALVDEHLSLVAAPSLLDPGRPFEEAG